MGIRQGTQQDSGPEKAEMEETVDFRHSPHLPGISVLDARRTARHWHVVNSAFGLAAPVDWVGDLRYRGKRQVFGPGEVFCTEPGEVHSTARVVRPGSFEVFMIEEEALAGYVEEIAARVPTLAFRDLGGSMSPALSRRLAVAFELIGSDASPLHVQSSVVELVATFFDERMEHARRSEAPADHASAVARARERLHEADGERIDLETLAREAGISRFHLLRAFKQRYGLPPHAYQVGLRIAKAQRLLRAGLPPAHVAIECGFVDQSHFTRHFKQVLGVTPGRFARDLA